MICRLEILRQGTCVNAWQQSRTSKYFNLLPHDADEIFKKGTMQSNLLLGPFNIYNSISIISITSTSNLLRTSQIPSPCAMSTISF
jgi:hypothetical protein